MRTALKSNRFRLAKQLCTCITLFCTFPLTTMHDYKVKVPNFMFCEHTKTTSFFSFTSIQPCRIKLLEKFANSRQIGGHGILSAMKFKAARILFFSDVFLAVAFVGAKAPYLSYCRWTTFKSSFCWRESYEGVSEFAEIPIKDGFVSKQKAIIYCSFHM